jgi:phage tail-like protein
MDRNWLVLDPAARPELYRAISLERDEHGALGLARLPRSQADVHSAVDAMSALAGLGVDADGNVYAADPERHRIWRWDCRGERSALPCLEGPGAGPAALDTPRGVLVTSDGRLMVADSGNDRVQVFDLATQQLLAMWAFDRPVDLAEDTAGCLYVSDARGIHKRDRRGRPRPAFRDTFLAQAVRPAEPGAIAVGGAAGIERLLVADTAAAKVLVYRLDGRLDAEASAAWDTLRAGAVVSIAASAERVYVADSRAGRVLVLSPEGTLLGRAAGLVGTVSGLALDCRGRIVVHGAPGERALLLDPEGAYAQRGELVVGPLDAGRAVQWHRVEASVMGAGTGAHLRLFTLASDRPDAPPALPAAVPAPGAALTPRDAWRAQPADAPDVLALNEPGRYLWIGAEFDSDGRTTPRLGPLRVSFSHDGWLRHLPVIYRDSVSATPVLERMLALFEARLDRHDRAITDLPLLADPHAASNTGEQPWLEWLAGWLDLELEPGWNEATRRDAIAQALGRSALRGTRAGLAAEIRLHCGVEARIEEAHEHAHLWSLGERSTLGFDTGLASSRLGGALLGASATLGGSHLVDGIDDGSALFEGVAHHVLVEVYADTLHAAGSRARLERLLDEEVPAHLAWRLGVIGAAMQVGAQARVGIDTIVAGAPATLSLGVGRLGADALDGSGDGGHAALGNAQVGHGTRLR